VWFLRTRSSAGEYDARFAARCSALNLILRRVRLFVLDRGRIVSGSVVRERA